MAYDDTDHDRHEHYYYSECCESDTWGNGDYECGNCGKAADFYCRECGDKYISYNDLSYNDLNGSIGSYPSQSCICASCNR